uniref:Uncharacterized protein n=1 Tax=Rhizophora mucronata TaxID=61149 RepID=A0A2P2R038_RHIMU
MEGSGNHWQPVCSLQYLA